jgi:hypothetical protein
MNWATFKDAVQAWFAAATGLTCIWAQQPAPAPTGTYGLLSIIAVRELGAGELSFTYDKTMPAGSDMIPTATVHSVVTVGCQVLVPEPAQGTASTHATRASHYTELARLSLRMPAPLAALRAKNIAHVSSENTQDLSGVWGGRWYDRAGFDVHLAASSSLAATTGESYIDSVGAAGEIGDVKFTDTTGA